MLARVLESMRTPSRSVPDMGVGTPLSDGFEGRRVASSPWMRVKNAVQQGISALKTPALDTAVLLPPVEVPAVGVVYEWEGLDVKSLVLRLNEAWTAGDTDVVRSILQHWGAEEGVLDAGRYPELKQHPLVFAAIECQSRVLLTFLCQEPSVFMQVSPVFPEQSPLCYALECCREGVLFQILMKPLEHGRTGFEDPEVYHLLRQVIRHCETLHEDADPAYREVLTTAVSLVASQIVLRVLFSDPRGTAEHHFETTCFESLVKKFRTVIDGPSAEAGSSGLRHPLRMEIERNFSLAATQARWFLGLPGGVLFSGKYWLDLLKDEVTRDGSPENYMCKYVPKIVRQLTESVYEVFQRRGDVLEDPGVEGFDTLLRECTVEEAKALLASYHAFLGRVIKTCDPMHQAMLRHMYFDEGLVL